jgi:hypothetical protein
MSKFLNLLNSVLNEQELNKSEEETTPVEMDSVEKTALPKPEEVALDALKYKNLLTALREALYIAFKNDLEKQRVLSNIRIDSESLNDLKQVENDLMSFLSQTESIPSSVSDE